MCCNLQQVREYRPEHEKKGCKRTPKKKDEMKVKFTTSSQHWKVEETTKAQKVTRQGHTFTGKLTPFFATSQNIANITQG